METWRHNRAGTFCTEVKTWKIFEDFHFQKTPSAVSFSVSWLPGLSSPFLQSCFPDDQPLHATAQGLYLSQVWSFTFPFVEFQDAPVGSFLKPVQFPLGSTSIGGVSNSSWFCLIRKSTLYGVFPRNTFRENHLTYRYQYWTRTSRLPLPGTTEGWLS